MVLVEGLTEIRPVNAIPPVAGLLFGPIGAFACGIGNLAADFAGTFSNNSILGFIGNMLAAYLPYRLWHWRSRESPNLHSMENILWYCVINLITSLVVSSFLFTGVFLLSGMWIKNIFVYTFFNNLVFSIGFGMPLFIILTCEEVGMECCPAPQIRNRKIRMGGKK